MKRLQSISIREALLPPRIYFQLKILKLAFELAHLVLHWGHTQLPLAS